VLRVMRDAEAVARSRADESPSLARIEDLDDVPAHVAPEFEAVLHRAW